MEDFKSSDWFNSTEVSASKDLWEIQKVADKHFGDVVKFVNGLDSDVGNIGTYYLREAIKDVESAETAMTNLVEFGEKVIKEAETAQEEAGELALIAGSLLSMLGAFVIDLSKIEDRVEDIMEWCVDSLQDPWEMFTYNKRTKQYVKQGINWRQIERMDLFVIVAMTSDKDRIFFKLRWS